MLFMKYLVAFLKDIIEIFANDFRKREEMIYSLYDQMLWNMYVFEK